MFVLFLIAVYTRYINLFQAFFSVKLTNKQMPDMRSKYYDSPLSNG